MPVAETIGAAFGQGYLQFMGFPIGSPTSSIADWTFDVQGFRRLIPESIRYDSLDPDLTAFQQAGGRLILWHGWADQVVSPYSTIDYYAMLSRRMGGIDPTQRFARLFLIPAMYHCGSGSYGPFRFSLVDRLVTWVEDGTGAVRARRLRRRLGHAQKRDRAAVPGRRQRRPRRSAPRRDALARKRRALRLRPALTHSMDMRDAGTLRRPAPS